MPKSCQLTGKKITRGFRYSIRGIAKKKKGIGLKVTSKTKRRFQPNLTKKRFWLPEENRFITLTISRAGMRTIDKNGISKVVRQIREKEAAAKAV